MSREVLQSVAIVPMKNEELNTETWKPTGRIFYTVSIYNLHPCNPSGSDFFWWHRADVDGEYDTFEKAYEAALNFLMGKE